MTKFLAEVDVVPLLLTLTFSDNMRRQCFNVTINDDSIFEGTENFLLLLEEVANETVNLAGITNASVTILDNDGEIIGHTVP